VLLTTGYSTAYHLAAQQQAFLGRALGSVSRLAGESQSLSVGLALRAVTLGSGPTLASGPAIGDLATWNWRQKALELRDLWSNRRSASDAATWHDAVTANLGIVAVGSISATAGNSTRFQRRSSVGCRFSPFAGVFKS